MHEPPPNRDRSTANAFDPHFLRHLGEQDDSPTAFNASLAGPWAVFRFGSGYAVARHWEQPARGDRPRVQFDQRHPALLAAAALSAIALAAPFELRETDRHLGFTISRQGSLIGWSALFDPSLLEAVALLEGLIKSPVALATLLEAAGATALETAGRLAARDLGGDPADGGPLAPAQRGDDREVR